MDTCQVGYHGIVGIVHGIHHAFQFLDGVVVEGLVVHVPSGQDAAYCLARIAQ